LPGSSGGFEDTSAYAAQKYSNSVRCLSIFTQWSLEIWLDVESRKNDSAFLSLQCYSDSDMISSPINTDVDGCTHKPALFTKSRQGRPGHMFDYILHLFPIGAAFLRTLDTRENINDLVFRFFSDATEIAAYRQVYFNADDFKIRSKTLRHRNLENIVGTLEPFSKNP